jgi:nicotinamidase-related amidase
MTGFQTERTAVLVIDLQKDNFNDGAWPVAGYERLLTSARDALTAVRGAGLPVIYTRHWLAETGADAQRHEPRDARGAPLHSVAGTRGAEICDEVAPAERDVVIDKTRFSALYATRLETVLTQMAIEHLIVLGVWSEACVQSTVYDAVWRDYRVTLVKDACGAATDAVHKTAMLNMANWLYGGGVVTARELAKALAGEPYAGWRFTVPNEFPFTLDSVEAMYQRL